MKAYWWQGGVHIDPETPEDVEALRGFFKVLDVVESKDLSTEIRTGAVESLDQPGRPPKVHIA